MVFMLKLIVLCVVTNCSHQQIVGNRRERMLRNASKMRNRITNKIMNYRQRNTAQICYDIVGCFQLPHARSPLQKTPENPKDLDTKFYLFRRDIPDFTEPESLRYENATHLNNSRFNSLQPVKVFIHGYMSRWNEKGAIVFAQSHLKLDDCNVIIMDWMRGARGPQYTQAAANTEVVGRQLGVLLKGMIAKGLDPMNIHLVGFSLGAHVAGCASEVLKKDKKLIGRITGLDAASPLFRTENLKEKNKKLDKEDAHFVDVLHTDSSPMALDGFGLWRPIGHVDFFANGGREQPGCIDKKPSIIVSKLEGTLTRDTACSHIRAYHLFLETLVRRANNSGASCEFLSFECMAGPTAFENGECFPELDKSFEGKKYPTTLTAGLGIQGEHSEGRGVLYFVTNSKGPYCGTQLQSTVHVTYASHPIKGLLQLTVQIGDATAEFNINCIVNGIVNLSGIDMRALAATDNIISNTNQDLMIAHAHFINYELPKNMTIVPEIKLQFDKVTVRDIYGNRWYYCGYKELTNKDDNIDIVSMELHKKIC